MIYELLLGAFIFWPFLALFPASLFALTYLKFKKQIMLINALTWLTYFVYEQAMQLHILCSGECNIRVDLLLIYPSLLSLSGFGLFTLLQSARKPGP